MKTILTFLRSLEANNNKAWFDSHKGEYLEARAHFNSIVEKLLEGISDFDPTIKGIGVNDCTYRIYKDMRFSKDGLPYKTHFGASLPEKVASRGTADTISISGQDPGRNIRAGVSWLRAIITRSLRC